MNRDSVIWWFGMIGGAATTLAMHFDLFPWMTPNWRHAIELIGFIGSIASGKFATSPLSNGDDKSTLDRMKGITGK